MRLILIGLGGAIGTVLRYIVSGLDYKYSYGIFPISTLVVNLAGSFAIGFLWGIFEAVAISPQVRMFVFIGILGGFTTFSTFALENFNLLRDSEHHVALLNILVSNVCGIFLVFAGYALARMFLNFMK
jgi:CrcB protein